VAGDSETHVVAWGSVVRVIGRAQILGARSSRVRITRLDSADMAGVATRYKKILLQTGHLSCRNRSVLTTEEKAVDGVRMDAESREEMEKMVGSRWDEMVSGDKGSCR
jgi:hypothetical protein